jgi:signal transduction histidine kinase
VISSVAIVTVIAVTFAQAQLERATSDTIRSKELKLDLMADGVELRLEDATKVLRLVATQEHIRNVQYANSVNEKLMGIPQDVDPQKRQVAQVTRSIYQDFDTVAFLLPNGDVYLVEPFDAQKNLPRLNFAFREYYQGIISNGDAYIGEAVVSSATGHRVVPIAVAVYGENVNSSRNLTGILVGALNMNKVAIDLREDPLGRNEEILITDHKGSIVADSTEFGATSSTLKSLLYVNDVSKALEGDSGSSSQTIDGVDMFITYKSIRAETNNWAAISMQPHDDAFFAVDTIGDQSIMTVVLVLIVSSISGYFLFRSFKGNSSLTTKLGILNENLKKQTAQLKELDKEKEEFSAMITHELKTPLVPVVGYSELLLDGTLGELTEKQKQKLHIIHESASSLSRLISDLLDARKLELGKMRLVISNSSVKEMMEQCLEGLRLSAKSKEVTLSFSVEDNNLMLKCDAKRIQQVLYNLLTNALKFVPVQTGKIAIRAAQCSPENNTGDTSGPYVLFTVKDNGAGIPKEKQRNLFKKFYQADTSLTRNVGGTGLGLAISKGIVEAHNGKIWFESEEGKGSIFSFMIPTIPELDLASSDSLLISETSQANTAIATRGAK